MDVFDLMDDPQMVLTEVVMMQWFVSCWRGWLVNPLVLIETGHWWMVLATAVPGILATVLIFLDQQITAVIVNRKEHKLKVCCW